MHLNYRPEYASECKRMQGANSVVDFDDNHFVVFPRDAYLYALFYSWHLCHKTYHRHTSTCKFYSRKLVHYYFGYRLKASHFLILLPHF